MGLNTALQMQVTDFFKNSHSRSSPRVGDKKAGLRSSTSQKKLLSLEGPGISDKENENSKEELKTPITPIKCRLRSGGSVMVSCSERAKATSKKKATTKVIAKSATRSVNCVDRLPSKEKLTCSRKLFEDGTSGVAADTNNNSSNTANSENQVKAYLKHRNLIKQTNSEEDELQLPLPVHYSDLLEQFKTTDEVTAVHQKRQQTLTWSKLKQSIELSTKRTFTLNAFVKMLTVLERDSKKWFKFAYDVIDRKLQLTIAPLYPDHIRCINSAQILLERQKEFHLALLELTKQDHLQYLAENGIVVVEAKQFFAWHPMYPLDGAPEIIPNMTLLPPKPKREVQRSITSFFARREPAKETVEVATTAEASPPSTGRIESGKFKGVKMDLLKKIREKEAAKKAKFNFCPPAIDLEISSLSTMPRVMRIVNQYFQNTAARSHTTEALISSIASSTKWSASLAEKRLNDLLAFDEKQSLASGGSHKQWMRKVRSAEDGTVYLMINPDYKQVHSLQQLVQLRINQLRESIR